MITITPINAAHLPRVQLYATHPSISATSNVPSPYPATGALTWFALISQRIAAGQSEVFAITFDQEFCGVISLNNMNHVIGSAELDYWVAVPYQKKGIASEAAALTISHARLNLGIQCLFSSCLASNAGSIKVLARNGFVEFAQEKVKVGKFQGQELKRFRLHVVNSPG